MYFYLQGTKTTPQTLMNNGYLRITGNAFPVEQMNFFSEFNRQVGNYLKKPANITIVEIALSFVNAAAKRSIIEFFNQLEKLNNEGFQVNVKWWYEDDDDDVKELGEIYRAMYNFNIDLIKQIGDR